MGYKLDYGFLTRQERHIVDMAAICHSQNRTYIAPDYGGSDFICKVLVKRGWLVHWWETTNGYRLTEAGIEALRKIAREG